MVKQIKNLPSITTVASSDLFIVQRASDDQTSKVTGANMVPAGSITPDKFISGHASDWDWISWTPTPYNNLTVGNGTLIAQYCRVGKLVFFRLQLALGSTSSLGNSLRFTLPITPGTGWGDSHACGTGIFRDSTAADEYVATLGIQGTDEVQFHWPDMEGSSADGENFPATEDTGDYLSASGFYGVD